MNPINFLEHRDASVILKQTFGPNDEGFSQRALVTSISRATLTILSQFYLDFSYIKEHLLAWNTEYLISLSQLGAEPTEIEGRLQECVQQIEDVVEKAQSVYRRFPFSCSSCRLRYTDETNLLYHMCAPLKSGRHLCPCGNLYHTHGQWVKHALPNPDWLDEVGKESDSGSKFGIIDWSKVCGPGLVQLLFYSMDVKVIRPAEFKFKCTCNTMHSNFVHFVAHCALCSNFSSQMQKDCFFCPQPRISEAISKHYSQLTSKVFSTPVAMSKSLHWPDFHSFFLNYRPESKKAPSSILQHDGILQAIVETEFDSKKNRFEGGAFESKARLFLMHTLSVWTHEFDQFHTSYSQVCSRCFHRSGNMKDHLGSSNICAETNVHRCKCGTIFSNHFEYWIHMMTSCHFIVNVHLILFALLHSKDTLTCACKEDFALVDLHLFLAHWTKCVPMIQLMTSHCSFCKGGKKSVNMNQLQALCSQLTELTCEKDGYPNLFVLGIRGCDLDRSARTLPSLLTPSQETNPQVEPPRRIQKPIPLNFDSDNETDDEDL